MEVDTHAKMELKGSLNFHIDFYAPYSTVSLCVESMIDF